LIAILLRLPASAKILILHFAQKLPTTAVAEPLELDFSGDVAFQRSNLDFIAPRQRSYMYKMPSDAKCSIRLYDNNKLILAFY
jgi:hypothetical protein